MNSIETIRPSLEIQEIKFTQKNKKIFEYLKKNILLINLLYLEILDLSLNLNKMVDHIK